MCSKPIIAYILLKSCSERQHLLDVARTAKRSSKRQNLLKSDRAQATVRKRWRLYILPQCLANLTQPIKHKEIIKPNFCNIFRRTKDVV